MCSWLDFTGTSGDQRLFRIIHHSPFLSPWRYCQLDSLHVGRATYVAAWARPSLAGTRRWANVVLMPGHRLGRWPGINTTLGQRLVFTGSYTVIVITRRDSYHPPLPFICIINSCPARAVFYFLSFQASGFFKSQNDAEIIKILSGSLVQLNRYLHLRGFYFS